MKKCYIRALKTLNLNFENVTTEVMFGKSFGSFRKNTLHPKYAISANCFFWYMLGFPQTGTILTVSSNPIFLFSDIIYANSGFRYVNWCTFLFTLRGSFLKWTHPHYWTPNFPGFVLEKL